MNGCSWLMPTISDRYKYPSVILNHYAPISKWQACEDWNHEINSTILQDCYDDAGNKVKKIVRKFHSDSERMTILQFGNASKVFMTYGNGTFDEYAVYVHFVDNGEWGSRFIYDSEWLIIFKEATNVFGKAATYATVNIIVQLADNARMNLINGMSSKQVLSDSLQTISNHCHSTYNKPGKIYDADYDSETMMNTMVFWSSWLFFACLSEERKARTALGSLIKACAFIDAVDEHPDWGLLDICNHYRVSYAEAFGLQGRNIVQCVRDVCRVHGIINSWNNDVYM